MKLVLAPVLAVISIMSGCASPERTGGDACTIQAVGEETGGGELHATLLVPQDFLWGGEITNGGVIVSSGECDFSLNAFLSDETANYIIDAAPNETLTNRLHGGRSVDADLGIWKFADASGKPRFFVVAVDQMTPISRPRTASEARDYELPPIGE